MIIREGPLKGRRFEFAPQTRVTHFAPEIDRILAAIGHPEALVTDRSPVSDFSLEPAERAAAEAALGIRLIDQELLADIAERLRGCS